MMTGAPAAVVLLASLALAAEGAFAPSSPAAALRSGACDVARQCDRSGAFGAVAGGGGGGRSHLFSSSDGDGWSDSSASSSSSSAVAAAAAVSRRRTLLGGLALISTTMGSAAGPARAKVEGYAPPPKKTLSEEYRQGTAALADMDENAPIPREAYKKLPSGLVYADLRAGSGDKEASVGSKCNIQWVLRKGNGYFVDSSEVSGSVPFIFTVGDGTAIEGLDEGIRGMKAGGTRRLLMPVSMGYVDGLDDGKPGPLPVGFGPRQQMRRVQGVRKDVPGEYIFMEIQLTRVR